MECGLAKVDITPRVGVEMSGFGPYLCRASKAVRDRLWARALALRDGDTTVLIVACDLLGLNRDLGDRVRALVAADRGLPGERVLIHCTHCHSAPATCRTIGWGRCDDPYMELLPHRLARAAGQALDRLEPARLSHAEVPCEGIALNRVYDRDAPPLAEVLRDDWRPALPARTDTTCHVLRIDSAAGRRLGFVSYFGCHPVVCCQQCHYLHGDYAGVATNLLEREQPGSVGLFLQGALGDVNSCCVHKPEAESLLALDVIASRYANSVRRGLAVASAIADGPLVATWAERSFSCIAPNADQLRAMIAEKEAIYAAPDADDADRELRMNTVAVHSLRNLLARLEAGEDLSRVQTCVQGLRLGDLALYCSPFEVFQAIKNEVHARAGAPIPLLTGISNDMMGYAPDREHAAAGGYAVTTVPMLFGRPVYADIHNELVAALLDLDGSLGWD